MMINGQLATQVAASDRGLHYGDGCFTTARIKGGEVELIAEHLQRLADNSKRLAIPFKQWSMLEQEMRELAKQSSDAVLKVILTRGSGGRGYSSTGCEAPTRLLQTTALPTHYSQWQQQGITLLTSLIRLGQNSQLAGIKHLNRLEQVLIRQHLNQKLAQEALVLDQQGNIVECGAANLFWRKGSQIFTPILDQCGVAGVMRQQLLRCFDRLGYACQRVTQPLAILEDADEVFICNALLPVVPVIQIDQWHYPIGHIVQQLIKLGFTAD